MPKSVPSTLRRAVAVTATLGVALSLAAATTSGSASADEPERSAPAAAQREGSRVFVTDGSQRRASAPDAAEMQDLRTRARAEGLDLADLVESHTGLDEFSAYVTDLEQRRPGMFTTAGLASPEDGGKPWIQTTTRPGAAEIARMERLPLDVEVSYGAPATAVEIARLSEQLIDSVGARPGVVRSAEARYDHRAQVMRLDYATAEGARSEQASSLVGRLARSARAEARGSSARSAGSGLRVVTGEVDEVLSHEVAVTGGADLNFRGGAACTAGFTANRRGRGGVLTARHCPNRMTYAKRRAAISKSAAQTARPKFDLQFHRTITGQGHTTSKKFRATRKGARSTRFVRKVVNAPVNSTVCHWGRTSGYSCAGVAATNICVILSGQKTCALDATKRYISAPGDSGGPWFYGNIARGIHAGGGEGRGNDPGTSLFTRIGRTDALGAHVLRLRGR